MMYMVSHPPYLLHQTVEVENFVKSKHPCIHSTIDFMILRNQLSLYLYNLYLGAIFTNHFHLKDQTKNKNELMDIMSLIIGNSPPYHCHHHLSHCCHFHYCFLLQNHHHLHPQKLLAIQTQMPEGKWKFIMKLQEKHWE